MSASSTFRFTFRSDLGRKVSYSHTRRTDLDLPALQRCDASRQATGTEILGKPVYWPHVRGGIKEPQGRIGGNGGALALDQGTCVISRVSDRHAPSSAFVAYCTDPPLTVVRKRRIKNNNNYATRASSRIETRLILVEEETEEGATASNRQPVVLQVIRVPEIVIFGQETRRYKSREGGPGIRLV